MDLRRPVGITILAVLNYMSAAAALAVTITCFFGTKGVAFLSSVLGGLTESGQSSPITWTPFQIGFVAWIAALFYLAVAEALRQLKNWARLLILFFTGSDLVLGGLPTALGVTHSFIPDNLFSELAARIVSFVLFLYLISAPVRAVFGVTEPRKKWLIPAMCTLALASLAFDLSKSGPEFRAFRWHMRHGDRISVNGVSFPMYAWWAPVQESDGGDFEIVNHPGPLAGQATRAFIVVKGSKDAGNSLSVDQLIEKKLAEDKKAGYTDLRRYAMPAGKQTLECVENPVYDNATYCYGDGPIYTVIFGGSQRSLLRFKRMMAEAK